MMTIEVDKPVTSTTGTDDPVLQLCHIARGAAQVILSIQAVYEIDDHFIARPVNRLMDQVKLVERLHKEGKL